MTQEYLIKTNSALRMVESVLRRALCDYIPDRERENINALCNILSEITRENEKAIKMLYDDEEIDLISRLMRNTGSGFEAQIGETLSIADSGNVKRLLLAFPELYQKYSNKIDEYGPDHAGEVARWRDTRIGKERDLLL